MLTIKSILVIGLFLFVNSLFAQLTESGNNEILQDFSKFQGKAAFNLIPFRDRETGKYGYIGALLKQIVVPAKYDDLNLFKPNMYGVYKRNSFILEVKQGKIGIKKDRKLQISVADVGVSEKEKIEKGFKVFSDQKDVVEEYAEIYSNVDTPFRYEGKLYAVAKIEDKEGNSSSAIIDEGGIVSFGFDFSKYKQIVLNEYQNVNGNPYFLVLDNNDELYFMNLEHEKIVISEDKGERIYRSIYHRHLTKDWITWSHSLPFGYGFYKNRILDFSTMEWLPEIADGVEILMIDYTSSKSIDASVKDRNDPNVKIYLWVKDNKSYYPYYMGWDGYRYIP